MNSLSPVGGDALCKIPEDPTSKEPCHLLALPPELRRMIFHQIFGSITVYLRSIPDAQDKHDTYRTWNNVLEWNNPCPPVLRVNHQLRDEALEVVLQNCVLDIWGSNGQGFFKSLPKAAAQIKHVAIAWDRCEFADYIYSCSPFDSCVQHSFRRQLLSGPEHTPTTSAVTSTDSQTDNILYSIRHKPLLRQPPISRNPLHRLRPSNQV